VTDLHAANRTYHVAQSHMELLPNYYAWTYGLFRPWLSGTVVELGCGAGLGLPHYAGQATRVYAVDHDDALLARVRAKSPPSVTAMQADLMADHWQEFDGITADAVLMMDVLEHFADDARFLAGAARLLRPGGHLLIKVPAQSARYSPMDEASGHYRRYDPADIEALAAGAGLAVVSLAPINRLGGIAYRLKNDARSNFSKSFARWQLQAINLGLPLVRAFDHLPVAGGLSLAAVLRKG
jgi:SAM-dependent methyltransferase